MNGAPSLDILVDDARKIADSIERLSMCLSRGKYEEEDNIWSKPKKVNVMPTFKLYKSKKMGWTLIIIIINGKAVRTDYIATKDDAEICCISFIKSWLNGEYNTN